MPNDVSITPTPNFIVFSGHARQRRADRDAGGDDHHDRDRRGGGREADVVLVGAEGEHDEHDLEPFEQHALERRS